MGRNKLIYGGVSKYNAAGVIFEWVSESTACETCKSLNGTYYNSIEDIPDRPHPNCKCYVKDIHIGTEDYESLQREIDKIYGDLSSLRDQILTSMNEEESDIQNSEIQDLLDDVYAFEYDLDEVSSDFEQVSEEDSTGNFERFKAKINEIKNNFQELKQKIIEKINGLKKEVCDCIDTIKKFDETLTDAENTKNKIDDVLGDIREYGNYISSIEIAKSDEYENELQQLVSETLQQIHDIVKQAESALDIFLSNYNDMKALRESLGYYIDGADEYYHTKANCQAAQLGDISAATALLLGYIREILDFFKEILFKGQSIKDAFEHGLKDLESNRKGRKLGRENPDEDPRDIIKRPDRIPEKYW